MVAIAIGVTGSVAGEAGDAPELQLLGALFIIGAIASVVRGVLRSQRVQSVDD